MVSKDNTPLATIPKRRANWYISKNLAKEIPPPKNYSGAIQLFFNPILKRPPKSFEINVNENKCVICGKRSDSGCLNIHHVVPWVIRRYFPPKHKNYSRQWCVLLCVDCHEEIEMLTQPLYKQNFPNGSEWRKNPDITLQLIKSKGNLNKLGMEKLFSLLERSSYKSVDEIPPFKQKNKIKYHQEASKQHKQEIAEWATCFILRHGGIEGTQKYFRDVFLTMNPKYLPEGYLDLEPDSA